MSDYYEALGQVERSSPMPPDGHIVIPTSAVDAVPMLLRNIPPDEIAYAGASTVMRDTATNKLMIDTNDIAQSLPTTEWALRSSPAVMRVLTSLGGQAIDGFLVDYRQIGLFSKRYSGLEEGVESSQFQDLKEANATVFPLGVILNDAGIVHYIGHPELQDQVHDMMRRVDIFITERWPSLFKHSYLLPPAPDAIVRPVKPYIVPSQRTAENGPLFLEPTRATAGHNKTAAEQEAD